MTHFIVPLFCLMHVNIHLSRDSWVHFSLFGISFGSCMSDLQWLLSLNFIHSCWF